MSDIVNDSERSNRKYLVTGAAVLAIAAGAYGLGRVYPPLGPTAGTVGPADRYVSSQIGAKDVTLGESLGRAYIRKDVEICRYLATRYGAGEPHP